MSYSKAKTSKAVVPYSKAGSGVQSVSAKVSKALAAQAPVKLSPDNRTFHVEDYRAASAMIKALREGKTTEVRQQWVDAMAASVAAVFKADAMQYGVPFSPAYFVAGTK